MDDQKIVVYSKGYNGETTYSIFNAELATPIITNKKLKEISPNFVRMYPGLAKKINNHFQDFSGDMPEEMNLNNLDGGSKFNLIEAISLEYEKNLKK